MEYLLYKPFGDTGLAVAPARSRSSEGRNARGMHDGVQRPGKETLRLSCHHFWIPTSLRSGLRWPPDRCTTTFFPATMRIFIREK